MKVRLGKTNRPKNYSAVHYHRFIILYPVKKFTFAHIIRRWYLFVSAILILFPSYVNFCSGLTNLATARKLRSLVFTHFYFK